MLGDEINKLVRATMDKDAGARSVFESVLLTFDGEVSRLETELRWVCHRREMAAIAVKVKNLEGHALRHSYNEGYKDGLERKFEPQKFNDVIKD